jgi:hypothetical protein
MSRIANATGLRLLGTIPCAGGGQLAVRDGIAYIAHMTAPNGTSIVDVRDPRNPRVLAAIAVPPGTHAHKIRVVGDVMVTNREVNFADPSGRPDGFRGGIVIHDVSDPSKPREMSRWETDGAGVHRFDFDGRYVYCSPTVTGYRGNIVMILDIHGPVPVETGRWWKPGQWIAGGETPSWAGTAHRCHHPLRFGNRLYTSYWHGGFEILDISNMSSPKRIAEHAWNPPSGCPTHSAVLVPFEIAGRRIALVADEDVDRAAGALPARLWTVDVTDENTPQTLSSFQVDGIALGAPEMTGCHQPVETIVATEIPVAWFANGVRIIDIGDPGALREVAHFVPDPLGADARPSSNDVFVDERGLIYLIDRMRGVSILERC